MRSESRDGPDHDPLFTVSVTGRLAARRRPATGARKREAEQAAAMAVLLREGVWTKAEDDRVSETGAAPPTRSGFVALIGAPNAGKSTLVNRLVGAKVSIVTHKVQTTRAMVRGIAMHGHAQIIFVDTPGIFEPKRRLDRAMVDDRLGRRQGCRHRAGADRRRTRHQGRRGDACSTGWRRSRQPKILVLNKVDRVQPDTLLALAAKRPIKGSPFERTFMVSALTGSGCRDLLDYLAGALPEGPWYYPEDQISDLPMRQLAAEITREKLFLRLHQELPYSSHVETEQWEEKKDGSVRIEQMIYVERDSQKKIVLGRKGETIRAIGQAARTEIAEILEQPVHLFLFVKVRENWGDDPERYRAMGIEFPR